MHNFLFLIVLSYIGYKVTAWKYCFGYWPPW